MFIGRGQYSLLPFGITCISEVQQTHYTIMLKYTMLYSQNVKHFCSPPERRRDFKADLEPLWHFHLPYLSVCWTQDNIQY